MYRTHPYLLNPVSRMIKVFFLSRRGKTFFLKFSLPFTYMVHLKHTYRIIRTSLRDFRPLRYSSRDGHAEGEHVNRGTDTPSFYPTLQVLDISTLVDAADVNSAIKFLPHTCNLCGRNLITGFKSAASPRLDISSTCKVGQKFGVPLPLLTCSHSV